MSCMKLVTRFSKNSMRFHLRMIWLQVQVLRCLFRVKDCSFWSMLIFRWRDLRSRTLSHRLRTGKRMPTPNRWQLLSKVGYSSYKPTKWALNLNASCALIVIFRTFYVRVFKHVDRSLKHVERFFIDAANLCFPPVSSHLPICLMMIDATAAQDRERNCQAACEAHWPTWGVGQNRPHTWTVESLVIIFVVVILYQETKLTENMLLKAIMMDWHKKLSQELWFGSWDLRHWYG